MLLSFTPEAAAPVEAADSLIMSSEIWSAEVTWATGLQSGSSGILPVCGRSQVCEDFLRLTGSMDPHAFIVLLSLFNVKKCRGRPS